MRPDFDRQGQVAPIHAAGARPHRLLPYCYHSGMSKQIAVRLPDELVDFVDELVGSGAGRSRAAVVTVALEREHRRAVAARDAEILARTGPDPELAGLAEHAAGLPLA
jgi:Arc/MetJ-type ribon-helix-helix transcriptional regulator